MQYQSIQGTVQYGQVHEHCTQWVLPRKDDETHAMRKTMTKFWMKSKLSAGSRWHSSHEGGLPTTCVGKVRGQCRYEVSTVAIMVRFTRRLKEQLESSRASAAQTNRHGSGYGVTRRTAPPTASL